jgi:hypothetical protein
MRKSPRRHLNYANVTATLALVLAMSGGAFAAKHYLINSTKQISPKVLKALKGKAGKAGAAGKEGPSGKDGAPGATGKEGLRGAEGAPGSTGNEGPPGKEGPRGEPGPKGAEGPEGAEGPHGSALAYAHVNANGTLDATNTSGNIESANVKHTVTGVYEFTGLSFAVHSVGVTLGLGVLANSDAEAGVLSTSSAEVAIRDSKGTAEDANFYIVFN